MAWNYLPVIASKLGAIAKHKDTAGGIASILGNLAGRGAYQDASATGAEQQYMQMLKRRSQEGMYSRGDRAGMLQDIAMQSGGIAHQAKQGIQNQMVGQGLEGSIIGSQAGLQADASKMKTLADANIGLNRSNKKFMLQAEDQLLGKKMELANRMRSQKYANKLGWADSIEDMAFSKHLEKMTPEEFERYQLSQRG
tara:strand:+ start:79 stop:666 length:588 start_codon:yes stop_codon:yes gene_type:complete